MLRSRLSIWSLAIAWLSLLASLSHAAPNLLSHTLEKFWLWERYEVAVNIEGPEKQQDVLPFSKQAGQEAFNNRGSGVNSDGVHDGRLTYSEFMCRLNNAGLDSDFLQLTPPGEGRTIDEAAQELMDHRLGGQTPEELVNPKLRGKQYKKNNGKPGKDFDKNDPHRSKYTVLYDSLEESLTKYRIEGGHESVITPARMKRFQDIGSAIVLLRREDTQNYVGSLFRKDIKNGGLGLGDDGAVVTETKKSEYAIGPDYEKVNIKETFAKNKEALQAQGFKKREDLANWAKRVGDPSFTGDKSYSDPEFRHFRALRTWKNAKARALMDVDMLKACKN